MSSFKRPLIRPMQDWFELQQDVKSLTFYIISSIHANEKIDFYKLFLKNCCSFCLDKEEESK